MIKIISLLSIAVLGLSACTGMVSHHSPAPKVGTPAPIAITKAQLVGAWQMVAWASNGTQHAPITGDDGNALTIEFTHNDRVAVLNGCNLMSGAYRIEQGQLKFGALMSTRKMCEPDLMAVDSLANKLLQDYNQFAWATAANPSADAPTWVVRVGDAQYWFIKRGAE
ncbi:META domain-containing protein [Moraxella sp. FZLJ2107]|uniref:META domain-containing protein n=1 Tax=unclassified Moraxella TaxID=2685852 RepID=UPI0020C88E85|nr:MULTISPECIES: META domain-containing protein [unclassified Moraxella]UTO04872.1 META domain-containing protein [Moraxella sp. FZLJ2107]UTO21606.1 META domain-containing protein [Moraxella sp. FZLJ2109]